MKKIVPVAFIIIVAVLAVIALNRTSPQAQEEKPAAARVIVPQVTADDSTGREASSSYEDVSLVSFIELNSDETLIRTESLDFDDDGYDDQVNAIKTASSPYLQLLIGLYNPQTQLYERVGTIATPVTQVKTFSYTGADLTGEHRTALLYQGFDAEGNSVLQACFVNRNQKKEMEVDMIANLKGDGTIFVQEMERNIAYTQSGAKGIPYPIWVYSSDPENPQSTDQIHSRYEWNSRSGKYELAVSSRITGSRIAASELARIQDGTVSTFAEFLDGMWYKTEARESMSYLFFDWNARQIIFLMAGEEEVFDWQNSNVRRNGMYISSTNLEIENLRRNVNVTLRGVEEIYLNVNDDVRMLVSENSQWNGLYKRVTVDSFRNIQDISDSADKPFIQELEKGPKWTSLSGTTYTFEKGRYTVVSPDGTDTGRYSSMETSSQPFIQFRSETEIQAFSKMYLLSYAPVEGKKNTWNHDIIILEPYIVTPDKAYSNGSHTITLYRQKSEEN